MSKLAKWILWTLFPVQCCCCVFVIVFYKAWNSNIPEEVVAAVQLFPFPYNAFTAGSVLVLLLSNVIALIVLLSTKQISVLHFGIFLLAPWVLAWLFFTFAYSWLAFRESAFLQMNFLFL